MEGDLTYEPEHWTNDAAPASALSKYLKMYETLFNKVQEHAFLSLLPDKMDGLNALDYGCGCGRLSILCAKRGARVLGIDRSEYAVSAARLYAKQECVADRCSFIAGMEVKGSDFDIVIAKDIIEHVQDDSQWVRAVVKALKHNGLLVLSTQNSWSLTYLLEGTYQRFWRGNRDWMGWDRTHVRFYTPRTLRRVLEMHELKIERWRSMYIVPYDILNWVFLLRTNVTLPVLQYVDYALHKVFPFNRLGWALMTSCRKLS